MKDLRIGMIGYGFMGRAHSNAYRKVNNFFDLRATARSSRPPAAATRSKVKAFADKWGYESVETDWRKLVERKDIDAIDICTPNNTHDEIALAAAAGGQDDPVREAAGDGRAPRARRWSRPSRRPKVPNMVWYNYRRVPAVTLAKQLIDEGKLGRDLPLPGQVPAGLDDQRRPAAGRGGPVAARRRRRPAAASPATCSPTASTPPSGSTARSTTSPR